MVNKKINQKYFVVEGSGGRGRRAEFITTKNPYSGTIVSTEMSRFKFDFFLAAQNVTQGTCTPTHYICLYNSTKMT